MTDSMNLFQEIEHHLLYDQVPSEYLNLLYKKGILKEYPFHMLTALVNTEQSKKYHPEGNVWIHTLMVVDEASKVKEQSSDEKAFMWAALLHDIGKPSTTKVRKGKITSYNHDMEGAIKTREFLEYFHCPSDFIDKVVGLVRYHMQILFVAKDQGFANLKAMKEETNVMDVALLGRCDRFGRGGIDRKLEEENISMFLKKCKEI